MANEYRITTNAVEVLATTTSNAQVASVHAQVLYNNDSNAQVASVHAQVLYNNDSNAQVASVYMQVLRSVADLPFVARRRQMVLS